MFDKINNYNTQGFEKSILYDKKINFEKILFKNVIKYCICVFAFCIMNA